MKCKWPAGSIPAHFVLLSFEKKTLIHSAIVQQWESFVMLISFAGIQMIG